MWLKKCKKQRLSDAVVSNFSFWLCACGVSGEQRFMRGAYRCCRSRVLYKTDVCVFVRCVLLVLWWYLSVSVEFKRLSLFTFLDKALHFCLGFNMFQNPRFKSLRWNSTHVFAMNVVPQIVLNLSNWIYLFALEGKTCKSQFLCHVIMFLLLVNCFFFSYYYLTKTTHVQFDITWNSE